MIINEEPNINKLPNVRKCVSFQNRSDIYCSLAQFGKKSPTGLQGTAPKIKEYVAESERRPCARELYVLRDLQACHDDVLVLKLGERSIVSTVCPWTHVLDMYCARATAGHGEDQLSRLYIK